MSVQLSSFIDKPKLEFYGGRVTDMGISIGGWNIETTHSHISGEAEIEEYKKNLGKDVLSLPEILFGKNMLKLSHEELNLEISFTALDALKKWKAEAIPSYKLDIASDWQKGHEKDLNENTVQNLNYDWTYTTNYKGTVTDKNGNDLELEECSEDLDWSLLRSTSEPILFYDSIDLYESELDDHGTCQLRIMVRCMPKCWFVLMRYFLRIDRNFVRLRETRLFNKFDMEESRKKVQREVKYWEGTFLELQEAGAPKEESAYNDVDSTSNVMQAILPIGIKYNKKERLTL